MTRLRRILNSPLAPLTSLAVGVLLALLGLWTSGAFRDASFSLALIAVALWAALATHKMWRVGQRIQIVEAATARGSAPAWARPLESGLSDVKDASGKLAHSSLQGLRAVEHVRAGIQALASDVSERTSGSTDLPAELLAALPTRYDADISVDTALDLARGLHRAAPETLSIIGTERLGAMIDELLDAQARDSKIVLLDPLHRGIELGLVDVLLIDSDGEETNSPAVAFLGALPTHAEIWILGTRSSRSTLAEQLQNHDQDLVHVIRPHGSPTVTMLGKAVS